MLIDYIDRTYSSLRKISKAQSLARFSIRKFSNFVFPIYLKNTKKEVVLPEKLPENIIVSLTTFPGRISKLWMVVECMLRQSLLPNKIVLYLAKDQFPNELKDIPDNLLGYYNKKQLEIRFVDEDLRSHKKYYYAFKEYQNDVIITIDDDIFYPSNIIKDLMDLHKKYPDTICCHRAHKVIRNDDNTISKYSKWKKVFGNCGPTFDLFHTSGGGTLYKSNFFSEEVVNKDAFVSLCFMADDVWLNIMAQLNRTKTVKSNYFSNLIPIENKNSLFKLSQENVADGGNDKQLQNLIQNYNINNYEIFK
ncbi:glycosyltransferase [Chryseobacterium sp. AG363]|uniref:glycosyltransferase n=1 Tax=Chryseobacterium sp. AG363 TaxID=2183997 RepID=UPI000E724B2F|nr:glycosyltransferase [Chryseobacterium sp. AG363]RKE77102.1 glycosyl transferase family 2 [Chryseobacterium sp. AG363]